MLWSGVMQMFLLAAFLAGWMLQGTAVPQAGAIAEPAGEWVEQVPVSYAGLSVAPAGTLREGKGDLDIPPLEADDAEAEAGTGEDAPEDAETDAAVDETVEEAIEETGPEGAGAQAMGPLLRMNRQSGKLEIGSFETLSLASEPGHCLEMGYTLLGDAGAPEDDLLVLAQSEAITMARICASNGSVVITCRMNRMTISPRRLKPNENCSD